MEGTRHPGTGARKSHADHFPIASHFQRSHPEAWELSGPRFPMANGERKKRQGEMDAMHRQPPQTASPREEKRQPDWDEPDRSRDQQAGETGYWMIFRRRSLYVRLDISFVPSRRTTAYSPWNQGSSRWMESTLTIADR